MRKIFTSIFLLLICLSFTQAQISSRMMVDKDSLAIGEEFEIEFRITASSNHRIKGIGIIDFDSIQSQVKTSDIPDSLLLETYAELEWPADFNPTNRIIPIKEFEQQGNDLVKKIPLRFWDIGLYILPQLEIIQDSTYSLSVQHFQTPFIQVLPPLNITPADTTQALMPIKHILKEPKTWEDFVWIAYALAGLFTLLLIGYMIYRSKHEVIEFEEKEEVIIRPAHVVSLEKLNQLDSKKLWQKGEIKAYQSELTYIIREYLENRFGIHALESTTEEITRNLKAKDFDSKHESNLKEILQIADLVKFAKATPSDDIHSRFMDQAVDFVEQTKKIIQQISEDTDGLVE